jgi:hypothetical protein
MVGYNSILASIKETRWMGIASEKKVDLENG